MNKGFAILATLITVGIASVVVSKLVYDQALQISEVKQDLIIKQVLSYHISFEKLSKSILKLDSKTNSYDAYTQTETWNRILSFPIEGGFVSISLTELNGKINLNNLENYNKVDSKSIANYTYEILSKILSNNNIQNANRIGLIIKDWIDQDNETINNEGYFGAESQAYLSQLNPYYVANNLLTNISELVLLKNMTDEINNITVYDFLTTEEWFTILPVSNSRINVNTVACNSPIWKAMFDSYYQENLIKNICVTKSVAQKEDDKSIETNDQAQQNNSIKQEVKPYSSINKFFIKLDKEMAILDNNGNKISWRTKIPTIAFDVKSKFFKLNISYNFNECDVKIESLLERISTEKVNLIQRNIKNINC